MSRTACNPLLRRRLKIRIGAVNSARAAYSDIMSILDVLASTLKPVRTATSTGDNAASARMTGPMLRR